MNIEHQSDRIRQRQCYDVAHKCKDLARIVLYLGFKDFSNLLERKEQFFLVEGDRAGGCPVPR